MTYIVNAFSLNMIDSQEFPVSVNVMPLEIGLGYTVMDDGYGDQVYFTKIGHYDATELVSGIGHADTCNQLNELLKGSQVYWSPNYKMNRVSLKLKKGSTVVVAQYTGPRLPEGTTVLPEGANFKFYEVTICSLGEV